MFLPSLYKRAYFNNTPVQCLLSPPVVFRNFRAIAFARYKGRGKIGLASRQIFRLLAELKKEKKPLHYGALSLLYFATLLQQYILLRCLKRYAARFYADEDDATNFDCSPMIFLPPDNACCAYKCWYTL